VHGSRRPAPIVAINNGIDRQNRFAGHCVERAVPGEPRTTTPRSAAETARDRRCRRTAPRPPPCS
jgi:hypothetical protein